MTFISSDAFNNPDSPVYYVVGAIFLLLIFGALAAYLLISKHLEKKKAAKDNVNADTADTTDTAEPTEDPEKPDDTDTESNESKDTVREEMTEEAETKQDETNE